MGSYAYYRLPYTDRYTIIESERQPIILSSVEDIGKERGFCIAPFDTTTHGRRTSSGRSRWHSCWKAAAPQPYPHHKA